ncbi:hypothetical protein SCHPADRAFT_948136 [Schizopora paradoxa]|uniref:BAH domain-containing protein n=1 Tax=Schizopora paradoxa TaxID=27342 RepID=A0A0H2QWL6_9AGAM|nr:hypothetical protein SCHPADRAFT_948136 [Schizopora paradoxa]
MPYEMLSNPEAFKREMEKRAIALTQRIDKAQPEPQAKMILRRHFKKGKTALILPNGNNFGDQLLLEEYWVCKIEEIKMRKEEVVFAKVNWFWNPKDVVLRKDAVLRKTNLGKRERLTSNTFDYVHSSRFYDMYTVQPYEENDVYEAAIDEDELYSRYDYNPKTKVASTPATFCFCKGFYNPDRDVMRVCLPCAEYIHIDCLRKGGSPQTNLQKPLYLQFERTLFNGLGYDGYMDMPTEKAHYEGVPQNIIDLARSPIVRGKHFGIVGNGNPVMRARDYLAAKIMKGTPIPNDWMKPCYVTEETVSSFILDLAEKFHCPKCLGPV